MSTEAEPNLLLRQLIQNFYKLNLNFSLMVRKNVICLWYSVINRVFGVLHYTNLKKLLFQPENIEKMDWDWQQAFLEATVNSKLIQQYPISCKFASLFLKKIIQALEPSQEVHDDFYSQLCKSMNCLNAGEFSYRHYVVGNYTNNIITIKETRNLVVNGTTGLKTWEVF